jgi:hypothetical protein
MGCAPSVKIIFPEHLIQQHLDRLTNVPLTNVTTNVPSPLRDRGLRPSGVRIPVPCLREYSHRLFLAFATNEFQHFPPLQHPIEECQKLAAAFNNRSFESKVFENLTKQNIMSTLFNLKVQHSDLVVLYFASHATATCNDVAYVVTTDSKSSEDMGDKLTNQELRCFAEICSAKHMLLMFDCCFAGRFIQSRGVEEQQRMKNFQLRSRLIITSGAMETVPDKSEFAATLQSVLTNNPPPFSALEAFVQLRKGVTTSLPLCSRWKPDDGGDVYI